MPTQRGSTPPGSWSHWRRRPWYTPFAPALGFIPLAGRILAAIAALVVMYLLLAEVAKRRFLGPAAPTTRGRARRPGQRVRRRAARFSTSQTIAPKRPGLSGVRSTVD